MNLVINLSQRFERSPDGRVWTPGPFAYSFWSRYLEVFDRVRVLARVRESATVAAGYSRADGDRVSFAAVPNFQGPWQYLTQSRRIRSAVYAGFNHGDAVILRAPCPLAAVLEPLLRRHRYPYAVEVVADPYDSFSPGAFRHPLRPLLRWYFPRQLRRQCGGSCATTYVSGHVLPRRYPCPAHEVVFSDVELPPPAWAAGPRPPRPEARSFTLISVGTLEQLYKAPDVLIDAVARCVSDGWDLRLVLIGSGQYRSALEARAAAHGLGERVLFRGHLPATDIRAALDGADLFVLPSRQEGLPRAMLEAMARALPCIGSRAGGIPELLREEDLVAANDEGGLADKIVEVLADPQRLARMSEQSFQKATEYRPEALHPRMLAFYRFVRERTQVWLDTTASGCRKHSSSPDVRISGNETPSGGAVLSHVSIVPQSEAMAPASYDEYPRLERGKGKRPDESFYRRHGKRMLDLALTVTGLVVLAPLLLVVALLVRLTLGSPVLFRQRRSGLHGTRFTILKYRTMTDDHDPSGALLPDTQRLTWFGRMLRLSSLDELPELFNILKGDMSLVGPRPLLPQYDSYYTAEEFRRFEMVPGITGWAQINGRNDLAWDDRLACDVWYAGACSFALDVKILVLTVVKVLARSNIQPDPGATFGPLDEERRRSDEVEMTTANESGSAV